MLLLKQCSPFIIIILLLMELWAEGPTCALWPVAWHLESGGLETSLSHCKVTYSGSYGMCGWLACPFDTLNCRSVVIEKVFNFTHAPLILNGNEPACVKLKSFTTHLQFSVKPPAVMLLLMTVNMIFMR